MHPYPYTGVVAAKVSDPCQTFIRKCLMSDDLKKKKRLERKKTMRLSTLVRGQEKKKTLLKIKLKK